MMKRRHVLLLLLTLCLTGCSAAPTKHPVEITAETYSREEAARLEANARRDAGTTGGYLAGTIYDYYGRKLCWTEMNEGEPYRAYDSVFEECISNIMDNATGGLRRQYASILTSKNPTQTDYFDQTGCSVVTYLDAELIRSLYNTLTEKGVEGAVVVMDVANNRVRAMVSTNGYSPTQMQLDETYEMPEGARNRVMEPLPPGSTFKMLSAPIADAHGIVSITDSDEYLGVHNSDHWSGARYTREVSLYDAVYHSSNVWFAKLFEMLGLDTVLSDLRNYFALSDEPVMCDAGYLIAPNCLNLADSSEDNLRRVSFGEGSVRSNLLYLSAVCAQVVTDGKLEAPRTLSAVVDTIDGSVIAEGTPEQVIASIPPENLKTTREAMNAVAWNLDFVHPERYELFTKTGTAEYGKKEAHYIVSCVYPGMGDVEANGTVVAMRIDNSSNQFASQDADVYEAILRQIYIYSYYD